jgi:hypothetical protein
MGFLKKLVIVRVIKFEELYHHDGEYFGPDFSLNNTTSIHSIYFVQLTLYNRFIGLCLLTMP